MSSDIISVVQGVLLRNIASLFIDDKWEDMQYFVTVPSDSKPPYIKIGRVSFKNHPTIDLKIYNIEFEIFVVRDEKNNNLVLEILDMIERLLPKALESQESTDSLVKIEKVVTLGYTVEENIQVNFWKGLSAIRVIVKANS